MRGGQPKTDEWPDMEEGSRAGSQHKDVWEHGQSVTAVEKAWYKWKTPMGLALKM